MADQLVQTVDVAEVEFRLPSLADDSVEELYRFGTLMVSSAQLRTARLDAKLTGILGWSSAALAFLLVGGSALRPHGSALVVLLLPIAITTTSVIAAYFGLESRLWPTPSERDWLPMFTIFGKITTQRGIVSPHSVMVGAVESVAEQGGLGR